MPPLPAAATADDPAPDAAVVAQKPDAAVTGQMDALAALEAELVEREHALAMRESTLAGRAGSLLAAAQALYDDVMGGDGSPENDELARLRRRKSVGLTG